LRERTLVAAGEVKHGLFTMALVIAIVFAMSGWVYASGWVGLKLIEFV
jgi:hypothetical protein